MPACSYTDVQLQESIDQGLTDKQIAEKFNIQNPVAVARRRSRFLNRLTLEAQSQAAEFDIEPRPTGGLTIDELVEERKRRFARKKAYEEGSRLIPVRIKTPGPIGILHLGDPHVDDDGTDIQALEEHAKLIRETDGMFCGNIGDTTNNWVGRLARLYEQQSTTGDEAWALAEWFINGVKDHMLYMIGGNHDAWSGSGDPLKWMMRQATGLYKSSEIRMALRFPNKREVRINAHHDFSGNSQWNPAHGSMKAAQLGFRDHVLINGHKHICGYGIVKCPATGILSHCIQVGSYKVYDRFAKEKGFRDQHISPCSVTVIDPDAKEERDLVQFFWSPENAADYLTFLRRKSRV